MKRFFPEQEVTRILNDIRNRHRGEYDTVITKVINQIQTWYKVHGGGRRYFIVGASGGVDSTVATYLLAQAMGSEQVVALNLPRDRHDESIKYFQILIDNLGLTQHHILPIDETVQSIISQLPRGESTARDKISVGNIASRVRVNFFYAMAREVSGSVIGTANRTEYVQGYATKYGTPISCDYGLLDHFYKVDIRELGKALKIPSQILERVPTTGYYPGQTHEDELGAHIDDQDAAAYLLFERGLTPQTIARRYDADITFLEEMVARYNRSEHKRMLYVPHVKLGFIKE
jgi:NAD+ synthase